MSESNRKEPAIPDLREKGRGPDGRPVLSDRRLYIQLLAFGSCPDPTVCIPSMQKSGFRAALYADLNDPRGIGLTVAHEHPEFFTGELRDFLRRTSFAQLPLKHEFTMFGRTYSIGYEPDLDHVLVHRPLHRLCNPDWPWAVWYPVRRSGAFEKLSADEQRSILMEHAHLGAQFAAGDHAYDIRLACHGLDARDNDFLLGLVGPKLQPLSAMVQAMRKSRQTSEFLASLGPFFIGRAIWQSPST